MATGQLVLAASARPFFRLDGVPVPISHKLLRLIVPFSLIAFLSSSALLKGTFYQFCAGPQLAFYGLAALGLDRLKPDFVGQLANVALTFLVLNSAAVVAFSNFLTGKKQVWVCLA